MATVFCTGGDMLHICSDRGSTVATIIARMITPINAGMIAANGAGYLMAM